ncbi:MAG: flagellar basal-body rod protein FlgF [Firmicutes bacterium HGW-Firmicutes-1]|jgi:flagellar basal-body rod protein FlgG|nr:MAG: flagellar basal-body rod protein FlgF [Firmicutes bacterium HGW-Firmicutes-1]
MLRGLYTAYTGMLAQQQKMDTISNNLTNANTAGYKREAVMFESFNDVYMVKINDPEQAGNKIIGKGSLGVKVGESFTNYEQGSLQQTDIPLNLALNGSGMFVVGSLDAQGNIQEKYTRDGSFGLNKDRQIENKDGLLLLGENGPITVGSADVRITEDGNVFEGETFIDKIKTIDFENIQSLKKLGGNIFEAADNTTTKVYDGKIAQGFIENSNVSSIEEMIHMINVMRTYEANQKIITTYDATLDKSVNEIGRL